MNNKKSKLLIIVLLLSFCLIYFFHLFKEANSIVKFVTSYYVIDKSNFISNELNTCSFSKLTLKNGVEISCKSLTDYCTNDIPQKDILINEQTACALITFDVNNFQNKPNIISTFSRVNDQYQILRYSNGITTIPNSIEDNILHSKKKTFKRRIHSLLMFFEIKQNSEMFNNLTNNK